MQGYVQPKVDIPNLYTNYQHEIRIHADGRPQTKSFKLSAKLAMTASDQDGGAQQFPSMEARVNAQMDDICRTAMLTIEMNRKCRVSYFSAQFVLDANGTVWLSRTLKVLTVSSTQKRSRRPTQAESAEELEASYASDSSQSNLERTLAGSYDVPSRTEERIARRMARETPEPSQDDVDYILHDETSNLVASRRDKLSRNAVTTELLADELPAETVSAVKGRLLHAAPQMGSTQKGVNSALKVKYENDVRKWCGGDFCGWDGDITVDKDDFAAQKTKRPPSPGKPYEMQFKCVAQARAEKTLVDLLLRRHQRREHADYVTQKYLSDGGVMAENFPGHYYRPIKVCSNCYKVYNMIDGSRAKALKKIDRKAARGDGEDGETSARGSARGGTARLGGSTARGHSHARPQNASAEEDWEDPKETALRRAQEAVAGLSKSDVAELRSFAKPPPAVTMVTSALMIMLTGEQLPWDAAKRVLANGERFLQMLAEFHPDDLTPAQLRMLRPFVRSTSFHPSVIEPVSRCASKFCGWTLGMLQAHAWRAGMAGEDGEDGEGGGEGGGERSEFLEAMDVTKRADPSMDADAALGQSTTLPPVQSLRRAQGADKSLTFAEKLEDRRKQRQAQAQDDAPTPDLKARARARIEQTQMQQSQSMDSASFMGSTAGGASYMGAGGDTAMQASGTMRTQTKAEAKRTAQAKRNVQTMQMTRLATAAGREDMPAAGGDSNKDASGAFVYTCEDGQTKMPYVVLGKPDFAVQKVNIVVFHDFFDTMEATQIFFKQLVSQHLGCQVLIMNLPGQAGTSLPDDEDIVLNNEWQADRVAEMLDGLNATGEMLTHTFPFHCLGIGNGANIATALALRHGRKGPLAKSMRGLVLMNGFARVDSQLSAVLHSSVNVFSCFPPTRPDLPVSYFTRFLFSDEYLQKVDKNLALNLYTAVNNPISLEGRVKICKGALMHVDLRRQLQELNIPMVMVQSTENVLVNPTNIDPFLEGRSVSHLWSHQLTGGGLGAKGRAMLHDSINKRDSAFVMWLRAGHEVRQECKKTLIDLLNQLADPSADLEPLPQEIQPEEEEEESAEARTRPRRKKRKKKVGKGKSGGGGMASTGAAPAEQESDYVTDPEPEPQPVPQTQQAQQLQQLEETLTATKRQVEDAPSVPLPASITPAAIRQEQEAREPAAAPEQAAAEQAAPMSAADAEAAERERVFRLEEAEREFEDELKAHKQKKRQAEEALRRETEEGAQPEGGGSHGGDPSGAPGPEEAARIEQKIAQMKEMAEQRQQQADVEAEERISKLRTEQEQRRDQWASEDQQRLQDLESQLEIRQDERGADQAVREKAVGGAQAEPGTSDKEKIMAVMKKDPLYARHPCKHARAHAWFMRRGYETASGMCVHGRL